MKKIKILLAIIATIALMSTVVFADSSLLVFDDTTGVLTEGSVSLGIKATDAKEVFAGGTFRVNYNAEVWTYVDNSNSLSMQVDPSTSGSLLISFNPMANASLTADMAVMTVTFSLNSGKTVADDTTGFAIASDFMMDTAYGTITPSDSIFATGGQTGPSVSNAAATPAGTTLEIGGKTWTGVYVYNVSADVEGTATSLSVALTANSGEKNLGTYDVVGYIDNATVSFRAAIVNVPDGTSVSLDIPVFNVQ